MDPAIAEKASAIAQITASDLNDPARRAYLDLQRELVTRVVRETLSSYFGLDQIAPRIEGAFARIPEGPNAEAIRGEMLEKILADVRRAVEAVEKRYNLPPRSRVSHPGSERVRGAAM